MKLQDTEIYSKLPDDLKVFIAANQAFSESLVAYSKVLESVVNDVKDLKVYFKETRGGFREDLENIVKKNDENIEKRIKILEEEIKEIPKQLFNKILILFLSSTGLISLIVYLVEHFLFNDSVNKIVQEILEKMPK